MNLTVGQRLQKAREELGISIEEAAHETRIRVSYLQELEADHPELLHSATQARGFLRLYADYLNLPYEELLALWESKPAESEVSESSQEPGSQPKKNGFPFKAKWFGKDQAEPAKETEGEEQRQPAAEQQADSQPEEYITELSQFEPELETAGSIDELQDDILPEAEKQEEAQEIQELEELLEEEPALEETPVSKPGNIFANLRNAVSRIIPFIGKNRDVGEDAAARAEAVQPKTEPAQTSEDIFREIGQMMYSRRKMMELNLSDIENFTSLKRAFLVSIEEGRFGELPSTVQGRGMLNNYAKFLGMEESAVMDLYGRALQLQREERQKPQRQAVKSPVSVKLNLPEKWRKILNPDLVIGGVLIIGLFAFIIWGATQVFSAASAEPTEAPSISEVLQITATTIPTEIVETPEEEVQATDIPGVAIAQSTPTVVATVNAAPLQLYIITHDRAYMEVLVDGIETFSGRVSPENVYTYSGNESINLVTGNASALEVYFNQEYLGKLGDVGEVVDIDFTLAGLITPTPQATATPTPTTEAVIEDTPEAMDAMEGMAGEE